MHCVGICNLKLWQTVLLVFAFHVLRTGLNVPPCFALPDIVQLTSSRDDESFQLISDDVGSTDYRIGTPASIYDQRLPYFFEHNEARVATALVEADANGSGTARASLTFPDWNSSDGCILETARRDLSFVTWYAPDVAGVVDVQLVAADSCTNDEVLYLRQESFEISSKPWRIANPEIVKPRNYVKVFVQIRAVGLDILGEGVYLPATGKMHLVGCTRTITREVAVGNLTEDYRDKIAKFSEFEAEHTYVRWDENEILTNVTTSGVCAMVITLQYPPWSTHWNWQRVVKFALRSTRDAGDALYFDPVERSVFYPSAYRRNSLGYNFQRRLATGARILQLLIGILFVALQIRHGQNHEEALPFASLAMLGIQITNHVSQTSIFKDLQIGRYQEMLDFKRQSSMSYSYGPSMSYSDEPSMSYMPNEEFAFLDSQADFAYYGSMAWHEYVPYQAMAMASIFMYVWIFHRVGDRRRIMQLRVRKGRPGAVNPPRDGQIVFATVTLFAIVGVVGVLANVVDRSSAFGEPGSLFGNTNYTVNLREMTRGDEFVSPKFYELWYAQWGVVNKVTGLVVSLFLLPQLLGNWRWEVQGRPLSRWFYVGLPLLQALPQLFTIAKYFQLLPIFDYYDPYLDSFFGMYENPPPWWQIAVVSSSALLVVAVHYQFAASFRPSRSQTSRLPGTSQSQAGDML